MIVLTLGIVLILMILVRSFVLEVFYIPSGSMENTLKPGDRVAVWRMTDKTPDRGQIVVFDGTGSLAEYHSDSSWLRESAGVVGSWLGLSSRDNVFVKRVIGVAGDTVSCCTADGRLTVNGQPQTEPYLYPGDKPSEQQFSVQVPNGRMWVMGDHRSDSADSRSLLGSPGGGMIRTERIIGYPVGIVWPLGRAQSLPR